LELKVFCKEGCKKRVDFNAIMLSPFFSPSSCKGSFALPQVIMAKQMKKIPQDSRKTK